jgi:DNA repair exonuclease SbcCD nuclease subunit
MKRTKITRYPTLILTSDWHLREDIPTCRTDDFWGAQWEKVDTIVALQRKYQELGRRCPIVHAGDLFDHWKPSPYLLSETAASLRGSEFYTIYGQHDLPLHNIELAYKCGINTLTVTNVVQLLQGMHFGQTEPVAVNITARGRKILAMHKLIWENARDIPPWAEGNSAKSILEQYPEFDLIVTGDNHKTFVVEHEGRLLVNPGSLTRQTADQENHKPVVFLWYSETNTVEPYYLPIQENVISREHIDKVEKRDARIEAFVSRLNTDFESDVSFEENLKRFLNENKIESEVENIVWKAIE